MRAVLFAVALASTANISRVVEVLGEFRGKVQADGEVELELYNTFACWCEDTMETKAQSITDARADIKQLSEDILKLRTSTASTATEMARLEKALASNGESAIAAEGQRTADSGDFEQQESDLTTCLGNLDRAITTLSPHKSTSDGFKDRADEGLVAIAESVGSTLDMYERTKGPEAIKRTAKARQWVQDVSAVQLGSPHLGTYAPQSTAIQGILETLKESLTSDLADLRDTEAGSAKANKELRLAKRQEKSQLEASLEMATSLNAQDGVTLASNELTRQETEAQLKADEALLANAKETCVKRATEWSTRSRIRTEELQGINEAIETLNSSAAQSTFGRQEGKNDTNASGFTFNASNFTTFVQLSQSVAGPRSRKQLSIITMAAKVTSKGGHFDEVMHYIDQYVAQLDAEAADDNSHKAWCDHERSNAENKVEAQTHDLSVLEAEHDRADDKRAELAAELKQTLKAQRNLDTAMETATTLRTEEAEAHKHTTADTVECIRLVESAIASVSKVSANNPSFLQLRRPRALLHKHRAHAPQPETWSGTSSARESDKNGVVAILANLVSTLEADRDEQAEEEADAIAQFNAFRAEAARVEDELEAKEGSLDRAIASKDRDILNLEKEEDATGATWNATSDYLDQLRPNCDWVELTYDSRKSGRADEVKGLNNAKVILSGFTESLVATKAVVQVAEAPQPAGGSVADELAELHRAQDPPPPPL